MAALPLTRLHGQVCHLNEADGYHAWISSYPPADIRAASLRSSLRAMKASLNMNLQHTFRRAVQWSDLAHDVLIADPLQRKALFQESAVSPVFVVNIES